MRDQSCVLPGSVLVRFLSKRCSGSASSTIPAWYTKIIPLSSAVPGITGSFGTKHFHDSALALFDGGGTTPTNQSALDILANQIALDYYNWNLTHFDESFAQIIAPTVDALTDTIEWVYRPDQCHTRRYSSPYNGEPEELLHNDPANTACADSLPGTIVQKTPCFESYGPLQGGTSSAITVPVFKNCYIDGILTQTYVRTESLGCGCGPQKCSGSVCVRIDGICPATGTVSQVISSELVVKLFKDGVFISNGTYSGNPPAYWCWTDVEVGTGYHIEVEDHWPDIHAFTGTTFDITAETCTEIRVFSGYKWLGWNGSSGSLNGCGTPVGSFTPVIGAEITVTQGSSTATTTTDSTGNYDITQLFSEYDPTTYIPLPITTTIVDPNGRFNTISYTENWSDVQVGFECQTNGTGLSGYTASDCSSLGDVSPGYHCTVSGCDYPASDTLNLEDSLYGETTLNHIGCDGNNRQYWEGSQTGMSPGCTKPFNCGTSGTVTLVCPPQSVTIRYRWTAGLGLSVSYDLTKITCPVPDNTLGLLCPQDGGTAGTGGPRNLSLITNHPCGVSFLISYTFDGDDGTYCPTTAFPNGNPSMYPTSGTITITEP